MNINTFKPGHISYICPGCFIEHKNVQKGSYCKCQYGLETKKFIKELKGNAEGKVCLPRV